MRRIREIFPMNFGPEEYIFERGTPPNVKKIFEKINKLINDQFYYKIQSRDDKKFKAKLKAVTKKLDELKKNNEELIDKWMIG